MTHAIDFSMLYNHLLFLHTSDSFRDIEKTKPKFHISEDGGNYAQVLLKTSNLAFFFCTMKKKSRLPNDFPTYLLALE